MTQVSKIQNIIAVIIATIIAAMVSLRIGKKFIPIIPFTVQIALVILSLLCLIIYRSVKKHKAGEDQTRLAATLAFWQAVIRYFIAMDMIMFGLEKITHLQFVLPLGILDNPFSSMSGEQLIWAFFGKFYSFTVIIAALQISGAILLLFSRTRLLGIFILMPIFCNLVLLDWYYDIGILVNLYITFLTLATIYLLLAEYPRLKEFFLFAKSSIPSIVMKSNWQKNMIRASAIIIPVLLMFLFKFPRKFPEIFGKYLVENGFSIPSTRGCDDKLTKVFIDQGDFAFEFDNYQNRWIGSYTYNEQTRQIKTIWRYPTNLHDTLLVKIEPTQGSGKTLTGYLGNKKLTINMQRVN